MTDQLPFFEAKKLRPTFHKREEVEKHTVLRELLERPFCFAGGFHDWSAALDEHSSYGVTSAAVGAPSTQFTSHGPSTVMKATAPAATHASCTIRAGM